MKKLLFVSLFMLLMSLFLVSCDDIKAPVINVTGHKVREITIKKIVVDFFVDVQNPNHVGADNVYLEYALDIKGQEIIDMKSIPFSVPANSTKKNVIPVELRYDDVFKSTSKLIDHVSAGNNTVPYGLSGAAVVNILGFDYRIPFEAEGELPLPETDEISNIILRQLEKINIPVSF